MIDFYYHATPNSLKVALLMEELGLAYQVIPVDIFKGDQHAAAFTTINPNGKVPAIVDDGIPVFDSHAILLHLAEKHGRFLPTIQPQRAATLSFLQMIATGLSPFSGQAVHFLHYAPEPLPYAVSRYVREVERHYRVLDTHLATVPFLAGDDYSIADIALFGWANSVGYILGDKGFGDYPHLARLVEAIRARPAAVRALALRERHAFKHAVDETTRRSLFGTAA